MYLSYLQNLYPPQKKKWVYWAIFEKKMEYICNVQLNLYDIALALKGGKIISLNNKTPEGQFVFSIISSYSFFESEYFLTGRTYLKSLVIALIVRFFITMYLASIASKIFY